MKNRHTYPLLFPVCLWMLAASACSLTQGPAAEGTLTLVIPGDGDPATKGSDVTAYPYEQAVNRVQLLLFQDGTRCDYTSLEDGVSFPYTKKYPSLGAGNYRIYVVANGPDLRGATTETALQATAIHLSDCGLTDATGFVMMESAAVQITPGVTAQVSVPMKRFAARVRVTSVRNGLPASYADGGAMTLKGLFLINALEDWNLGGTGQASGWVNLGGRTAGREASTERSDFISTAAQVPLSCRDQLFRTVSVAVACGATYNFNAACLYSFPNAVTVDHTGPTASWQSGAPSRLVVLARVNGADWWYPVTLLKDGKGLERNTTYDVSLVICATGSSDPNEPVTEAQLQATVIPTGWGAGTNYTEPL